MSGKIVPFHKFTSYGNNFLIVDETQKQYLTEEEKSTFACQATNINFGAGADGVIFLQRPRPAVFEDINAVRRYWKSQPRRPEKDMIFRLFEPNGVESFSCGNGLMCVANYLNQRYDILSQKIIIQIPTLCPKTITIGTHRRDATSWAKLGCPQRVPSRIAMPTAPKRLNQYIDILNEFTISFRQHDLHPFSGDNALQLQGYLVFTGEPHFVIFAETGLSIGHFNKLMFGSLSRNHDNEPKAERRMAFGTWLIHHIGTYLNKHYRATFPDGINVDFVKMPIHPNVVEYRCYERGINQETLSCGTGALAVAFVARQLHLVHSNKITVWPHRCRWYDPQASIGVEQADNTWIIRGNPALLMKGSFYFNEKYAGGISTIKLCEDMIETRAENNTEPVVQHQVEY
jgi:diaminopimelate epimerase